MAFGYGLRGHDLGIMDAPHLAEAVLAAGFDRLQLAPRKALLEFQGASRLEPATVGVVARAFRERGVGVSVLGCYVEVLHPDREVRKGELARLRESLELCSAFGSTIVATETGRPGPGLAQDGPGRMAELADGLGELCLLACRLGVRLALEAVWEHNLAGATEAAWLAGALDLPGLGFLLDPVNLVPESGLAEPAAPTLGMLEAVGPRILAVHAKDCVVADGHKRILACGQGQMPWALVLERLRRIRPDLDIIIEDQRPGQHAPCRTWLKSQVSESAS